MKSQDRNKERSDERNSNSAEELTPIYLTGDSTLQTPEEDAHDKSIDPRKDDRLDVSNDDLHETNADRFAGSDRAGTAERKDNNLEDDGE
jgi:hypothetical protein